MFRSDFRKKGVCSKSATKTLRACNSGQIFENTYFFEELYLHVTLFTVHQKETANEA